MKGTRNKKQSAGSCWSWGVGAALAKAKIEYKSLRTRRELATTPAWVLSRGIEMAKTENRKPKPKTENRFSGLRVLVG